MKQFLVLLLLTSFWTTSKSQDATQVYKTTVNSTVTIETDNSLGSGFFVADHIIATNYHVIKGASFAYCYTNNSSTKYKIEGYLAADKSVDLILLKVSGLNRNAIKMASASVTPGQKIYALGSPKGLPATISDGIVSGLRNFEGHKLIQMTAPISPGSSGGPVLNSEGQLVGISLSQLKEGQNLNFAIPHKYLKKLLSQKSTMNELMYLDEALVSSLKTVFSSVKIGTNVWMSHNLDLTQFRNGDYLLEAKSKEDWERAGNERIPAWCYYDNDTANRVKYGKLYNWYAVNDPRGLAPHGWHISSHADWKELVNYIGEANVGSEIKTSDEWEDGNGTNLTGFNAYPSGWRWVQNEFFHAGRSAYWWTANEIDATTAVAICLLRNSNYTTTFFLRYGRLSQKLDEINSYKAGKYSGLSVRCVKD